MKEFEIKRAAARIHVKLREAKISEKDKIFLTNCILVALSEHQFSDEYETYSTHKSCTDLMRRICEIVVDTVENISCETSVRENISVKLNKIYNAYFALIAPNQEESLYGCVKLIHDELANIVLDQPMDATGMLYHEFIRYSSGNRTSLGIVLTPTYVCDFMAKLIDIDNNSRVIDICCGSGALLSSAYREALRTSGDGHLNGTFVGCELDEDVYYASLMSMVLQKNYVGKIYRGNCFSIEMEERLRGQCFNKSLLNPPYAQEKQNEFEFMMKALSKLDVGGELAVICPSSCAIGAKFKAERKKIMAKHTLKAVFSMPNDVFFGNGASVDPCIMIWEAHKAHDSTIPTYFCYCKDKYVRRTNIPRWIEQSDRWIRYYKEKMVVDGESSIYCVTDKDEWLCEAYMQTNYDQIEQKDFERTLLDYLAYNVRLYGASHIG